METLNTKALLLSKELAHKALDATTLAQPLKVGKTAIDDLARVMVERAEAMTLFGASLALLAVGLGKDLEAFGELLQNPYVRSDMGVLMDAIKDLPQEKGRDCT